MNIGRAIKMLLLIFCLQLMYAHPTIVGAVKPSEIRGLQGNIAPAITELRELNKNPDAAFKAKITQAIEHLTGASTALADSLRSADAPGDVGGDQVRANLVKAQSSISSAIRELNLAKDVAKKDETRTAVAAVVEDLSKTTESLTNMTRLEKTGPTSTPSATPDENEEIGIIDGLFPYVVPGLKAVGGLLALGLLLYAVFALVNLRRTTNEYFGGVLPQTFGGVKARQDELARQIDASAVLNKEISSRLNDVQNEVRQMSRMLQQTTLANRPSSAPLSYMEVPAARVSDMPVFPIAADELLRQMHGKSVVLKRDFQNDMLVSDPDGKGELVLIRDSQIADEIQPLMLVPSVAQFQMRQEYYNFYQKYYDCANPESGAVWILDPAVVEKVAGGWQLREKGRLEVR